MDKTEQVNKCWKCYNDAARDKVHAVVEKYEQGVTKPIEEEQQVVAKVVENHEQQGVEPAGGKVEQIDDPFLCKNGCGFFGSKSLMNLCSLCYKDVVLKESRAEAVSVAAPEEPVKKSEPASVQSQPRPTRCFTCKKRVGLIGFTCRCGSLLCALHRYSDMHDCSFDFKSVGRDAIAKANPIVQADKVQKI